MINIKFILFAVDKSEKNLKKMRQFYLRHLLHLLSIWTTSCITINIITYKNMTKKKQ